MSELERRPNESAAGGNGKERGGPEETEAGPEETEASPEGTETSPEGTETSPEDTEASPEGASPEPEQTSGDEIDLEGMDPWSVAGIARMARATVAGISPEDWRLVSSLVASGIALDSRVVGGGEVFVALAGARTDGHRYISEAFEAGASAAIARRSWWSRRKAARALGIHLLVDDPLRGLQDWATGLRRHLSATVIGITGSSGKTTAKEILLGLLRPMGSAVGTVGNRNNQIGLPWTLLSMRDDTRWVVAEMGTNHPGEIAALSRIARPDVGVITCIGHAHEGQLGGAEGVLSAKLELLEGLSPSGTLVIPDDAPALERALGERWSGRVIRFGFAESADVRAEEVTYSREGTRFRLAGHPDPLSLKMLGEGALRSALAAIAATRALDLSDVPFGELENVEPIPGRLHHVESKRVHWLLDMYNASPESCLQSLAFLQQVTPEGRRVFVFGGMRELGEATEERHREVGQAAGFCDAGAFVGEEARIAAPEAQKAGVKQVLWCDQTDDAVRFLRQYLKAGDTVLLKGARSSGLERIARAMGVIGATYETEGL